MTKLNEKKESNLAYKPKKAGRPSQKINLRFVEKVISLRKDTDYGSQKLHFVLKKQGFSVAQRQIQRILDENKLTEPCEKEEGNVSMCAINGQSQTICGIVI